MKKLLVLSGKGGTGKTTVSAALIRFFKARAFADCDVDAPNLHLLMESGGEAQAEDFYGGKKAFVNRDICTGCGKCADKCRFNAIKLTGGMASADEISCEGCGVCEYVCPAHAIEMRDDIAGKTFLYKNDTVFSTAELKMGRGNSGKLVTKVKFALYGAAKGESLAVIDGSPGIGCPVIASVSGADIVLIVAEPSESGISDLERLVRTANGIGARLAVCVNRCDIDTEKTERIENFCREKGISFVGNIPYDDTVPKAVNGGMNIADIKCPASDAIYGIGRRVAELLEINEEP